MCPITAQQKQIVQAGSQQQEQLIYGNRPALATTKELAAASSLTRLPAVAQPFGWLNIMAGIASGLNYQKNIVG